MQNESYSAQNNRQQTKRNPPFQIWNTDDQHNTKNYPNNTEENTPDTAKDTLLLNLSKKLDLLIVKVEYLTTEQSKITIKLNSTNKYIDVCQQEIDSTKKFLTNKTCQFICKLSEAFVGKNKQNEQDRLRPFLFQFKKDLEEEINMQSASDRSQEIRPLSKSSSNESLDSAFKYNIKKIISI